MPTYQYKREDGSTFEIIQKISDEALKTCPETGQSVKRVITGGGGVVYKGSGWYVTDYKNKSNGGDSAGAGSSPSKAADKSNGTNGNGSTHGHTASSADSGASSANSGKADSESSGTNN